MDNAVNYGEHVCKDTFYCCYRQDSRCTFWEQAEAVPAVWEKVFPEDPDYDLVVIDTFREPCLVKDEERWDRCASFHIWEEPGWVQCETCSESLCSYMGGPFEIGDVLGWMKEES